MDAQDAVKGPHHLIALEAQNVKRLSAVAITFDGAAVAQITGRNEQGKQQPVSEPVLTPTGWRPIGALRVGDRVIGLDGRPTTVEDIFPQTNRTTYRVTTSDGASTRCGPDHLWTVSRWDERSGEKGRITETLTTAELIARGLRRGSARKWEIPCVHPVDFDEQEEDLPIDPYTLGIILGDGHIEPRGYTTITSWDQEVLDAVAPENCWRSDTVVGSGFWSRPLKHLGLGGKRSWEKFIPDQYLWSSVEDRRAMLAGLLDSDGTAPETWALYTTTSERLASDVIHLASSLGYVCSKRTATKKYRGSDGELKEGKLAWYVNIKGHPAPFTLKRKVEAWSPSERTPRFRFIDTVERVDDEDSTCIHIAASDGLYVTKDFLITHNSSLMDALRWAVEGTRAIQSVPIRKGADEASVKLDFGKIVVTKTLRPTDDGGFKPTLVVATADGVKLPSPQAILDAWLGPLTMDPLAMVSAEPSERADMVKSLIPGIDFAALERANKEDFQRRTQIGRDEAREKNAAEAITVPDDTPDQPVDIDGLIEAHGRAADHNRDLDEIARLNAEIERLKEHMGVIVDDAMKTKWGMRRAPVEEIATSGRTARATNEAVALKRRKVEHQEAAADALRDYEALTEKIDARKRTMADAIAGANLPVKGIAFSEDDLTIDDLPFDQASTSRQIEVAVALSMKMNPELRVIRIKDGEKLDDDHMRLIEKMAIEAGYLILMERVKPSDGVGMVVEIEGGKVASVKPAAKRKKNG